MAWGDSQMHFLASTVADSRSYSEKKEDKAVSFIKIKHRMCIHCSLKCSVFWGWYVLNDNTT